MNKNKVIFFEVQNIKDKLLKIIQTSLFHFEKKEKLLIKVQDEPSKKFVDELLWKQPPESFLPHSIAEDQSDDIIVITQSLKNITNANFMFNLCLNFIDLENSYKTIYDFDDSTSPKKKEYSKKRFNLYRQANFIIESR